MRKYENGKIYQILNSIDDEIYIGSTVEKLCQRIAKHKAKMEHKPHYKLYQHMALHGKDKFYIELLELFPCQSKEELRAREGDWIRQMATLNNKVAGRSKKQWYEDNRGECAEKAKKYREDNREAVLQRQKDHRNANIDKIREYDRQRYKDDPEGRTVHIKKWKEANKDYVKEQAKQWRENNKERKKDMDKQWRERTRQEIQCECGAKLWKANLKKHQQTLKHNKAMEEQGST